MVKMIISDWDGTLYHDHRVREADYQTLQRLACHHVIRVIATGRSLFSFRRMAPPDFPIDYLIFSGGAGVLHWQTGELLHAQHLTRDDVLQIMPRLDQYRLDYMIHQAMPENHYFAYVRHQAENPDFERRCTLYRDYAVPFEGDATHLEQVTQFLAVTGESPRPYERVKAALPAFSVIRTTSPLDHRSIWIEIFSPTVSKSQSSAWLCRYLGIERTETISLGNDYNDLDLLQWSGAGFMVESAVAELREAFPAVASLADLWEHYDVTRQPPHERKQQVPPATPRRQRR